MVGKTVLHYQFLEKLGEGGMGAIYKAQDGRLNRFVAIKVLTHAATGDPERKRRFIQEAQAASALNHPNIITIHDIISEGGTEYMVMEFVAGKTFVEVIPKGGLRVPQALKYSVQMADALQVAHNAGIVHRDLKPGNIMVTDSGLVKILDFGLAKLTDRGPMSHMTGGPDDATQTIAEAPLTVEGSIIGTVSYMSPEQAQGKKVDTRSDIFSFGVVLYEMVTGSRAFAGDSALSTLSAILRDDVRPINQTTPEVPPQLELVIGRCLRKSPDDRWQTMKDVQMALAALKHESDSGLLYRSRLSQLQVPPPGEPSVAPPSQMAQPGSAASNIAGPSSAGPKSVQVSNVQPGSAPGPETKEGSPSRALAGALAGIVLLAAIGGGSAWWMKHRKQVAQEQAAAAAAVAAPPTAPEPAPTPAPPQAPPEATAAPNPALPEDGRLTNDTIVEMVNAKVSPNLILSQIRSSKTDFVLTPSEVIRLSKAGVPETVIEQMRNPKRAVTTTASVTATPAPKQGTPAQTSSAPLTPQQAPAPTTPPQPAPPTQAATPPPQPTPAPTPPPAKPAPSTVIVSVPDATPFTITLAEDIPENAEEGRPLRFTVTKDVHFGDIVYIAKGATVLGAIAEVPGKRKLGVFGGGKMTFKLIQTEGVDGRKLNVRSLQARRSEGTYRPVDTGVPRKTKDVIASAGAEYLAYVDGPQTVYVTK